MWRSDKKLLTFLITILLVFTTSIANAQNHNRNSVQLHFGGKQKLPSIEINIDAAYRARANAEAARQLGKKIRRVKIEQGILEDLQADVEKEIDRKTQEKYAIEMKKMRKERELQEAIQQEAELSRKAKALGAAQRIAAEIAQKKKDKEAAKRLAAERFRQEAIENERLKKEAKILAIKKQKEEAKELVRRQREEKALLEKFVKDSREETQEKASGVEEGLISGQKINSEFEVEKAEEESEKIGEEEFSISSGEAIAPIKVVDAPDISEEENTFFGKLKSFFVVKGGKKERPELADVPKRRTPEPFIDADIEVAELNDRSTEKVAEVEENKKSEEVVEEKLEVEEKSAPKKQVEEKKEEIKRPEKLVVAEAKEEEPKKVKENIEEEEKVIEVAIPIPDSMKYKDLKGEKVAEPIIIELQRPEPGGDALSIASMFEERQEEAKMPKAMLNIKEPKQNIKLVDTEDKDNSAGGPRSILPSSLNSQESAAGEIEEKTEVASLSKRSETGVGETEGVLVSVEFLVDEIDLPIIAMDELDDVIEKMKADSSKRLSIIGYASNPDDTSNTARRVSLKRSLSVRKHLIDSGIDSTRINVQAMGNSTKGSGSKDRVDVFFIGGAS